MFIGSGGRRGGRAAMVLVAALMVAGTVGVGAAYLVKRGKAGIPGGPRLGTAEELRMVPGTASGFLHVRWKDARGTPGADELRQVIENASPHAKAAFDRSSGIDPKTIDRITVVYLRGTEQPAPQPAKGPKGPPPKGKGPPKGPAAPEVLAEPVALAPVNSYVILTFTAPYSSDKVQLAFVKNPNKRKVGDKEYIEDIIENVAIYTPDDTTLVVGDAERMGQLVAGATLTGPLSAALERAAEGGRHVVAALDMGTVGLDQRAFEQLSPGFLPLKESFDKVAKSQAVTLEVAFGEETKIEYRSKYRTEALADESLAAFRHIADYAREHSAAENERPDAPKPRGKSEVITKLIAPVTFGRLNEWLADASFRCQDDEVVIVPKDRSAATAYAALAATSNVLIKFAEKPKAAVIR